MVFNSFRFLLFFPVVLALYYAVPQRVKNVWLLLASWFFYACCGARYLWVLLAATVITYAAALAMSPKGAGKPVRARRGVFLAALLAMLGMLAVFKYAQFAVTNVNIVLRRIGIGELTLPGIALPVGISFFTFQAVGYLIDVYRGKYPAERNFVNYALFVSFFPQLLSGPIGRGGALLPQYRAARRFELDNVTGGALRFLWGMFLKVVISDRAAILVNTVFDNYRQHSGAAIVLATLMYALQIYTDFGGYSLMAAGCGQMLGIALPVNFERPYFAVSVKDFWRRWHISLSAWLRDYVYIPLGGSRRGALRKQVNVLVTFLVSGIWHGANWSFVAWGLLHGLYQAAGDLLRPVRERIIRALRIDTGTAVWRALRIVTTFALVCVGWLLFRANGLAAGLRMLLCAARDFNPFALSGGAIYALGLDAANFSLLAVCTALLLTVDVLAERGVDLRAWYVRQNWLFKVGGAALAILAILLFGVWGNAYDAANFIYFKF